MLFKIVRLVTCKLIMGNYRYPNVGEISAEDLREQIDSGRPPLLIDTRPTNEFSSGFGHIPNSKNIPLMALMGTFGNSDSFKAAMKDLEGQFDGLEQFREQEVVTICPGGGFSLVAAEIMAEAGFKDVKSLVGGADGWFKKGFATTLE
jgi:rhodanese-related sulfurtransferase